MRERTVRDRDYVTKVATADNASNILTKTLSGRQLLQEARLHGGQKITSSKFQASKKGLSVHDVMDILVDSYDDLITGAVLKFPPGSRYTVSLATSSNDFPEE